LPSASSLAGSGDAKKSPFPGPAARKQERDMKILVMFAAMVVSTILVVPTVAQAASLF
jgi:hypothetical protein